MSLPPTAVAIAAATLIAAAVGFFAGRGTAPTKTTERVVTVEKLVEVAAKEKTETTAHDESVATRDATVWRWRTVTRPSGEVVSTATRETVRTSDAKASSQEAKREAEVRYVDRIVEKETIKVVEAERATWSIGARAGLSSGPRAVYGAEASRRIVGPLWLGAYVTTAKEAGLMLRVEW